MAMSMTSAEPKLRRLQRIEVEGLFGIYNHTIDLELDSRVTLLHGPNGVGKTTILKMIDALLKGRFGYFRNMQFQRLSLGFHNSAELEVVKGGVERADFDVATFNLKANKKSQSGYLNLALFDAESIAEQLIFLERTDDAWLDTENDEQLTDFEVVRRYGRKHLEALSQATVAESEKCEHWLRKFLGAANSHFIEAQRLVIEAQRLVRPQYFTRWHRRPEAVPSRVVECSRELKRRIDDTMADYGRQAQTLDQSFPQRLLQRSEANDNLSVEEIRSRMTDLQHKTDELKDIGILDETPIHKFGHMESSQAGVMTLYVDDTAKKLKVLEDLASRARLLLESLNGKFRHKEMRVDRDKGLVVAGKCGDSLPLDSLSSGEQHELILHYDLLFRVQPNTVVLLDEPELSLHIAWQEKFLSDLMAIVQLSGFDALVATHSPYIVGDRDDLMVELAD